MIFIYKLRFPNDKVYIGQTNNLDIRWINGGKGYKRCPYVWNAIQKYGWTAIEKSILEVCNDRDEANTREVYWIAAYNSADYRFGYNIQSGGKYRDRSAEANARIKEKLSNRIVSEETRKKISKANKGKIRSAEYRAAQSNRLKAYYRTHESKSKGKPGHKTKGCLGQHWYNNGKISILCFEDQIPDGYVKGRINVKSGYKMSEDIKQKYSQSHKGKHMGKNNNNAKTVVKLELNYNFIEKYDTIKEASEANNNISGIGACADYRQKTSGGFVWRFYDEWKDTK